MTPTMVNANQANKRMYRAAASLGRSRRDDTKFNSDMNNIIYLFLLTAMITSAMLGREQLKISK